MLVTATQMNAVARPRSYLVAMLQSVIETSTGHLHARHPRRRLLANPTRRTSIGRELLTAAVLALSYCTGAAAQSGVEPSTPTPAFGPKEIGPWHIAGFTDDSIIGPYCSTGREVPGGAGLGRTLIFGILLSLDRSQIVLRAEDWGLKPNTTFPVELIVPPVLRHEVSAVAESAEDAWIALNRPALQKLATWPEIEVKSEQINVKLPLDAFDRVLAELDTCLNALKRPVNPFITPDKVPNLPQTAPGDDSLRPPPAKSGAKHQPRAVSAAHANHAGELVEERTVLIVHSDKGHYGLEAVVVRPQTAEGRLPIALVTHGRSSSAEENQSLSADLMLPQARDLALRGWLAVAVARRGYGRSDGLPGMSRSTPYMSCEKGDWAHGFDIEADDLDAALKTIAARPDADGSRAIAVGNSFGGGVVLALAARQPAGLRGVVNVSGGMWRFEGDNVCTDDRLVAAMASLGARTRIMTLWLYAENDNLFPPATVQRMREAYVKAGGRADLRMLPPVLYDGHNLFDDFHGRGYWLRAFDGFLRAQALPNANDARVERLMGAAKLPPSARSDVENYFSAPMPRILVVSPSGTGYWAANADDIDGARTRALTACRTKTGAKCSVAMEDNRLALPTGTGANP
jgi:dienelactone hydrolase